jgi:hypothetical protein
MTEQIAAARAICRLGATRLEWRAISADASGCAGNPGEARTRLLWGAAMASDKVSPEHKLAKKALFCYHPRH